MKTKRIIEMRVELDEIEIENIDYLVATYEGLEAHMKRGKVVLFRVVKPKPKVGG